MEEPIDREALEAEAKSGRHTTMSGCLVALAGILVPLVMFSIPSIFPCHGECQIGFAGIGFALFLTPVMGITGIVLFFAGMSRTSKAERELGTDDDRPPHLAM